MSSVLGLWAKEAQLEDLRREAEASRRVPAARTARRPGRGPWAAAVGFALVDVGLRLAASTHGGRGPILVQPSGSTPARDRNGRR